MPVPAPEPVSTTLQDVLQGRLLGRGSFKQIESYLASLKTRSGGSMNCSPSMMTDIKTILQQEAESQNFVNIKTLLCCIQHIANGQSNDHGLPVLLENGLLNLLGYTYNTVIKQTCPSNHTSSPRTSADACFIQLLETMNDVADHSSSTKEHVSQVFVEKLMAFIVNSQRLFSARMEAIRTLNLLLEGCSSQCLSDLRNAEVENLLNKFAEFLPRAGDFEMQVACTETLARFIKKSERKAFSEKCFPTEAVAGSFLNIRDACFEVDCRKFLNEVNESQSNGRGVFSLPCEKAFLGQYKLKCPQDDNLIDFWADFNSVSRSITIYIAEEGATSEDTGMWETVTLHEDHIKQVDIKKFGDLQHLNIILTVPVSQILPFCRSTSQMALIVFPPHHDLHLPLAACFSPDKLLPQNKVRRKSSECTIKVLFSRMGEGGSIHTENFYGRGGAEDIKTSYKESRNSRFCPVPVRTKISAPLNPMTSPPHRFSKDQGNSGSHTKKKSADSTPKTPKQQPPKRVKTPLNVSVSDKTSSTGCNNEDTKKTGTSERKDDGVQTASRSASPSQSRLDRGPGECDDLSDGVNNDIAVEDDTESESKEEQNQKSDGEMERNIIEIGMKRSGSDFERVSSSRENKSPSGGVRRSDEEGQIPSTPQIVPESQYSQTVVEDTQEGDVPDSHQASESPLASSQSASQGRRNGRRKKRRQPRRRGDQRKKRKSPRLEALEHMSALNPGREKRSKSGKFRLYSEGEGLVGDSVTPGDIIPSSCPSQDSMADFVPDSCPVTKRGNKEISTRRKSSSSPSLSDIPEKSTESTDTSEMDKKRTARTKPKRRRSRKAQVKSKSSTRRQKSKKVVYEEIEDETSSVSSTLHQTREFLSQSLPVLSPSESYNEDPYLFSDINDNSQNVNSVTKKETKERVVKVTKLKPNLNKPDKSSFLHKKAFMSFPNKSLTLPLVDSERGRNKAFNRSMVEGKVGDVDGTGDGLGTGVGLGADSTEQEEDRNVQRGKENMRGRARKKKERQPPVTGGKKGRPGKKGKGSKRCDNDFEGEGVVSSENENWKEGIEERKITSDGEKELNREMKGSTDGTKRGRGHRKGVEDENFLRKEKILKDGDMSFALREMREMSDVEVMRDAAHLEEDFQDDDIHGLIQSVKKFLGRPREDVTRKRSHGEPKSRMEVSEIQKEENGESDQEKGMGKDTERKDRVGNRQGGIIAGGSEEEDIREEGHETDGMERRRGKLKVDKESDSGMSFSDDVDTMDEINKELRALSKELQETGRRKKKQQGVGAEKYEENRTGESKKMREKEVLKTPGGTVRYGSDIEDEDEVLSNLSLDFDDKKTEASVQSFSKICKSIVYQSGDGIAKNRSRRDVPKVDYRDQDVSLSDEEYDPSLDLRPLNVSSDFQSDNNEEGYLSNTSRRTSGFTDVQSERSWLVEKSRIKVSTYSKVESKRWAKERQGEDVFKTIKKTNKRKKTESKETSASPENVALELLAPKKKKKKIAEDDSAMDYLYYQQNAQQSHPASQERLIQKVSSKVQREDWGVTPRSSHTSKSSGKTKIQDVSSDHDGKTDELDEPFSQEELMESQTTPGWGLTPQVKIGEEEEIQSDGEDPDARQILLSGPAKMSTLTQSFLKRKYEHMIDDITRSDEEDPLEEEDEAEMDAELKPPMVRRSINPRRLFENELLALGSTGLHGDDEPIQTDGESTSVTASSSSSNLSWKHPPSDFHIPEMMAIVGQKIQRQFAEKRNQTMVMTDSVLKSTQKYLSKIWAEQNHGRQAALEDFRESLLKEIVALEIDVENLNKTSSKLQAMAQRRLKTGVEMNSKHAMHIRSLHQSYIQELDEMDLYLEENLKKSVKTIVEQEFGSLKKKLVNDLHAQDVNQMKRALHSYLNL